MQQTSLLFPRKISHPLAAKALTIVLSIGAHYLIASNLGIFGSFTPLKLKSSGGTVKVVSLTPAEQTRVPEAVRSNPLPIAQNPVNPAPATRNFAGFSTTPTIPAAPPTTNRTANPTSPTSQPSSPSNNPNSPSAAPSSRPAPEKSTPRRSSSDPFDRNNRFSTMPRGSQSGGDRAPSTKPAPSQSNPPAESTRPNASLGNNNNPPATPPSSPPASSKPPKPPDGEPVNRDKPFKDKLKAQSNALRAEYPGQEVVVRTLPVVVGSSLSFIPGFRGETKTIEMSYTFDGKKDDDEFITSIQIDPSIVALLGNQKATDLSEASYQKARTAYQNERKADPNGTKKKIFTYVIPFKIRSQ
jgi:hypothetical protein